MSRRSGCFWMMFLSVCLFAAACDDGGGSTTPTDTATELGDDINQPELGSLIGTVTLSDGGDPTGTRINLGAASTLAASDGNYAIADVFPGTYTLQATLAGYLAHTESVDIAAGQAQTLDIVLTAESNNTAPSLVSLSVVPPTLAVGGTAAVTAVANDADGDTLTYEFSADNGYTIAPGASDGTAILTAPAAANASGTVSVIVRDGNGGEDTGSVGVLTTMNLSPVIDALTATPALANPGETIALAATASDPEGGTLTYDWTVDDPEWTLTPSNTTATLVAPNNFDSAAVVQLVVTDVGGGQATAMVSVATIACLPGFVDCDGDASNGCEPLWSGAGALCPATSCAGALVANPQAQDGAYWLDPNGGSAADARQEYCDMTAGGFLLLGTVAGGDADHWNTQFGLWADTNTTGSADSPWLDYKSRSWSEADLTNKEFVIQRRYDGQVRSKSQLSPTCLAGKTHLNQIFQSYVTTRSCEATEITTLASDAAGLAGAQYQEGVGGFGLGGASTNGLCWFGEDTAINTFKGHLVWTQDVTNPSCMLGTHLGGVGVFAASGLGIESTDITGTAWLAGTDFTKTEISFMVREKVRLDGSFTEADPAHWSSNSVPSACVAYLQDADYIDSTGRIDGVYLVDVPGHGPSPIYCDLSSSGGGWTLLGTVSGADANSWNTEFGLWSDGNTTGSADEPWLDYKSTAWNAMDLRGSKVMVQRRYDGALASTVLLSNACLGQVSTFDQLFQTFDSTLACEPTDVTVLTSSAAGVAAANFAEGASQGLGGDGTNGLCWGGGDTDTNQFRGHFVWNQTAGADCMQPDHLGGIGVFESSDTTITVGDIAQTDWLVGSDPALTSISFFARNENEGFQGDLSDAAPGSWLDGTMASSCKGYVEPSDPVAHPPATQNGVYLLDLDNDVGPLAPFPAYCELQADGGGWTLLGAVSGADADNWNTQLGYWSDTNTLGAPGKLDADYKSLAWVEMDITAAQILIERRYDGVVRAQSLLANVCLDSQDRFYKLFETTDVGVKCQPTDITTLMGSTVGVGAAYEEGVGTYALGSAATNGFCWNGGDNAGNIFDGHLLWNQYPGEVTCLLPGHLGGIGVYASASAQYTNADITGTNWLSGTDYTRTTIRIYAR